MTITAHTAPPTQQFTYVMARGGEETQEELAVVVKRFHAGLRAELKQTGKSTATVWQDHVQNRHGLRAYSSAMKRLATGPWASREDGGRIEWCVATCQEYFSSRLEQLLLKDLRRMDHRMPTCVSASLLPPSPEEVRAVVGPLRGGRRWRLLDVGSCYNPFLEWPQFEVTAVDIAPATESVYECDFLSVDIVTEPSDRDHQTLVDSSNISSPQHQAPSGLPNQPLSSSQVLSQLPGEAYDVVVFSLLLSYLPCTTQRMTCCVHAHKVLRLHGILLIVSPDSSHQNRHAALMTDWKRCIEAVGFHRWKYVKETHLHCMAFRKTRTVTDLPAALANHHLLAIPQDSQEEEGGKEEGGEGEGGGEKDGEMEDRTECFQELPQFSD